MGGLEVTKWVKKVLVNCYYGKKVKVKIVAYSPDIYSYVCSTYFTCPLARWTSMLPATIGPTLDLCTRYPLRLGGPRQCGIKSCLALPHMTNVGNWTPDFEISSPTPRTNTLFTWPHARAKETCTLTNLQRWHSWWQGSVYFWHCFRDDGFTLMACVRSQRKHTYVLADTRVITYVIPSVMSSRQGGLARVQHDHWSTSVPKYTDVWVCVTWRELTNHVPLFTLKIWNLITE